MKTKLHLQFCKINNDHTRHVDETNYDLLFNNDRIMPFGDYVYFMDKKYAYWFLRYYPYNNILENAFTLHRTYENKKMKLNDHWHLEWEWIELK